MAKARFLRSDMSSIKLCPGDIARYLFSGISQSIAEEDIVHLNQFISETKPHVGRNLFRLNADAIIWVPPNDGTGLFTYLRYNRKTKTGKIPKFTEELHFTAGTQQYQRQIFGEIYYQNGQPCKSKITHWENWDCVSLHSKMVSGYFSLWKIEVHSGGGTKSKIYI